MTEILRQLGDLFLQAVPTVIIVFLFYCFLRSSFFKPMERVLEERRARIEGARRAAEETGLAAEENMRAYQEGLKKAKADIYAEQEAARRAVLDERAKMLREARSCAHNEIRGAKEHIASDLAAARAELEKESQTLAGEIAHVVLRRRPSTSAEAGGVR